MEDHEIGALATAIENHGVHGTDRFGRERHFSNDEEEAKLVLAGLAEQFRWECCGNPDAELSPADRSDEAWEAPLYLRWTTYGWPDGKLPDVGEVVEKPMRQSDRTKRDDTLLSIIVVLAERLGIDVRKQGSDKVLLEMMQESKLIKELSLNTVSDVVKRAITTIDRRGK